MDKYIKEDIKDFIQITLFLLFIDGIQLILIYQIKLLSENNWFMIIIGLILVIIFIIFSAIQIVFLINNMISDEPSFIVALIISLLLIGLMFSLVIVLII